LWPFEEGGPSLLSFCAQRHARLKADEQFDAEIVANNSAIYLIVTSGRMASTNTCLCANFSQNEDAVEVDVSISIFLKKKGNLCLFLLHRVEENGPLVRCLVQLELENGVYF
jgi:hypothetical protein